MDIRIADFRYKEVINIADGFRMGFVSDVLFSTQTGQICAVVIPGPYKLFGLLGREEDYIVPWEAIRKIGDDLVIVDVQGEYRRARKKERKYG